MNTIITSIITSSAVSILTFILGLKSGKSQTDRAFLQEKYKVLYAHFSELEVGIMEKNPKNGKVLSVCSKEAFADIILQLEN